MERSAFDFSVNSAKSPHWTHKMGNEVSCCTNNTSQQETPRRKDVAGKFFGPGLRSAPLQSDGKHSSAPVDDSWKRREDQKRGGRGKERELERQDADADRERREGEAEQRELECRERQERARREMKEAEERERQERARRQEAEREQERQQDADRERRQREAQEREREHSERQERARRQEAERQRERQQDADRERRQREAEEREKEYRERQERARRENVNRPSYTIVRASNGSVGLTFKRPQGCKTGPFEVVDVVAAGAASLSGIKVNTFFEAVDGVSVLTKSKEDVAVLLKGKPLTPLVLSVCPPPTPEGKRKPAGSEERERQERAQREKAEEEAKPAKPGGNWRTSWRSTIIRCAPLGTTCTRVLCPCFPLPLAGCQGTQQRARTHTRTHTHTHTQGSSQVCQRGRCASSPTQRGIPSTVQSVSFSPLSVSSFPTIGLSCFIYPRPHAATHLTFVFCSTRRSSSK